MTAAISVRNLSKSFGATRVLQDVSLDIERGEAVSLIGRSGSGKTTLLRCLNLLEEPDQGLVFIGDEPIGWEERKGKLHRLSAAKLAIQRRRLGMVFQQFNLFPHLTVLENILEAPRQTRGQDRKAGVTSAMELLAGVGLADKRDSYPLELSGGQQQRVAIVRALAMEPEVILFDEPTSSLDPELVSEVLRVIRKLVDELDVTTIIVTHEIGFAREVCDRFVFMESGRIVEQGPAEILSSGAKEAATRNFLESVL
jgi:polar amino acid transport system ATP-binding protein